MWIRPVSGNHTCAKNLPDTALEDAECDLDEATVICPYRFDSDRWVYPAERLEIHRGQQGQRGQRR